MTDLLLHNLRTIGTHHCDGEVGKEAADEIERLRAELAALRAERDSLRAAAVEDAITRDEIARALHRADLEPRRFDPHWIVHEWVEISDEAREYWYRLADAARREKEE